MNSSPDFQFKSPDAPESASEPEIQTPLEPALLEESPMVAESAAPAEIQTIVEPVPAYHAIPDQRFSPLAETPVYAQPDFYFQPPQEDITWGKVFLHLALLGITVLTTMFAGSLFFGSLIAAPLFSFTLLSILGAHEMGHYVACRWYRVDATLPFFIPGPPLVGTFGAFIKIKSPIPSRRALFDIGIAGPLAGFVFAIPAAIIALYYAPAAPPLTPTEGTIIFHDPPIFRLIQLALGLPRDFIGNPVWFGAWVGMLVTSLNLLPIGQLDGGHVVYAVFGQRVHYILARVIYAVVVSLAIFSLIKGMWLGWVIYAVLLTLMLRAGHPRILDEDDALGAPRKLVAFIGLMVFLLCFMPFPISFF
jgi:membrane-associated protease RseP (regulator of RpoE activity)